ncbi:MAG: lysylphosphatidylglycerol synthase domain-containing protein [Ardenticatenia bacterium]|nr:lysylphosphatidylglycerol synthase domain-containing protein [Ardenticatenia bacterium]
MAAWLSEAVVYYLLMHAFGVTLPARQMVGGAILLLTLINLGILLPSAPGYVGTYEYFGKLALVDVLGVPAGQAVSVVVVAHAVQYALVTALGLFFMARLSLAGEGIPLHLPAGDNVGSGR